MLFVFMQQPLVLTLRQVYAESAIYISSARLAIKKGSSSPSTGGIMSSIKPPPACRWSLIK